MTRIDLYDPARDESDAVACWNAALGDMWPMSAEMFRVIAQAEGPSRAGENLVAREGGELAGVLLTLINPIVPGQPAGACIAGMAVARRYQRQGIGKALHDSALDMLRAAGITNVQLGGRVPRIWPGVPHNLPAAQDYFRMMGWDYRDQVEHDLTRSLAGFEIPAGLRERMDAERIALAPAARNDMPDILEFERTAFPGWYDEFKYVAEIGDHGDILVARDADGAVMGTLLMYSRQSSPRRLDPFWRTLLGEDCGGLNAVGVAERARGRGIGLALVAWGSDVLAARGVGTALIGWTSLVDFYGKLGYTPWQSYSTSWRTL